jgi:predicted small lipoprotein YifL
MNPSPVSQIVARRAVRLLFLLLVVFAALAPAACGKQGDLEPPSGKPEDYPRQYPDPASL